MSRDAIREAVTEQLMEGDHALPTSSAGRIGRTLVAVLRGARVVRKQRRRARKGEDPAPVDLAAVTRIVSSLGQLKGLSMKLGQMLSYLDVAVPEELQAALSALQTHAQPMPSERVAEIIREDLAASRAAELLATIGARPLAAASIGQVHEARLPDGTDVAVKVRYPEIDRAIASDFGAARIGTVVQRLIFPHAKVDEFIDEMRTRFLEECDYAHEAAAQQRFAAIYRGHETILVPAVHPAHCGRRVLTTTLVRGASFDSYLAADGPRQAERDRIGEALFDFYIGALFRHGLYNCDPHPGNYLFLADGRVAMLDYGCTRVFEPAFVAALAQLTRAVHADEPRALHQAFVAIGLVDEGRRYDLDVARRLVRGFFGPLLVDAVQPVSFAGVQDFGEIFRKKMQLMRLSLPGEFLFLFRIRYGLMSVLSRLGARANWYRLERRAIDALAGG